MATDISGLRGKVENEGMNEQGRLSANEFDTLVTAVMENQNGVKKISVNSGTPVLPDAEGKVDLTIALGDYEQILTLKYGDNEVAGGGTVLSADNNVTIKVQYKESTITQSGQETSYEATGWVAVLSCYSIPTTGEPVLLFSRPLVSVGHDSTDFVDIDLSEYLNDGTQNIQFRVTDTINSNAVQKLITVISANLKLSVPATASWFTEPIDLVGGDAESLTVGYLVQGVVQKTLHIKFYNLNGSSYDEMTSEYTESQSSASVIRETIFTDGNNIGFFTHGIHKIEAYLSCTVGSTTITTPVVTNYVVVIEDSTDTTPLLAIQNPITLVGNYETVTLFNYVIYKPNISASGAEVGFIVANNAGTVTYMSQSYGGITNGSLNALTGTIEVDSELTSLQASVFAKIDGENVNGSSDAILTFNVDNSVNYSPTSGADFYLNPKLRNNSESRPDKIYNSAQNNAEIIGCEFTNMSWMDGVDGWTVDGNGQRCLLIRAGSKVTIPYNAYTEFINNDTANKPLAIELDFAVSNITQEDDPFFLMGNGNANNPVGVYMKPTNGAFSPASVASWLNKDISWQEGVRTHVMFVLDPTYMVENNDDTTQVQAYPIIRTFIGGIINRELPLNTSAGYSEITANTTAGKSIIIGHDYADVYIYGIRVYKKVVSEPQVRQNRLSSLPTAAERSSYISANNITSNDVISLAASRAKGYNCIVWHGQPVNSRTGNVNRYGYAEIYRYVNGVLDTAHSGTLYGVRMKGQGTTAMNYAEWNFQFQDAKDSATVLSPNNKREFIALDGTNTNGKFGYRLETGDPLAKKLVGKVNYASSMQSHKEGACNLYNDLYRLCVHDSITNFSNGERVTVKEEPFFYFVQETEGSQDSLRVFQGLCTFGPGKADKPTWGVSDDDLKAGDSMLEGSDNNNPLTDMRVPWTDDGEISYSSDSEAFMYAGKKNLNFDFGDTADLYKEEETITDEMKPWNVGGNSYTQADEVPTVKQVKLWQPIVNFLYLTNVKIKPWENTLAALNTAAQSSDFDTTYAYWMTAGGTGYSQYDLFRCQYAVSGNTEIRTYVPAGVRLVQGGDSYTNFSALSTNRSFYTSSDVWSVFDGSNNPISLNMSAVVSLAQSISGETISATGSYARMNQIYKNCLAIIFRYYTNQNIYVHKESALFHKDTMVLWAGTDNRSKNTYYRFNTTLRCMEYNDDDLDTIKKTNNIGYQSKPYYVLEHDTDGDGQAYWEGLSNAVNNTIEAAYSDVLVKEVNDVTSLPAFDATDANHLALVNMMNSIFTAMISLVSAGDKMPDGTTIPQTVMGCMMKYFFRIQKYFPAVAYNETARIRYEAAQVFHGKNAIGQSLGDQYDSEMEYDKRRLIMLIGYARYKLTTGVLQNRGYGGDYEMALVPHFYMYPTALSGASINSGIVTAYNQRIPAGSTCNWTISTTGDTTVTLFEANHYRELGNLRKWPTGKTTNADTTLNVVSERLTKFECWYDPTSGQNIEDYMLFRAPQIDLSQSTNIEEINVRNCYNLSTFYNGLSNLVRLKSLDCRGTKIKTLQLPQTTSFTTLRLPAGFETLVVRNCPNLATLTIGDFSGLTSFIATNVGFDSQSFIEGAYGYNKDLSENVLQTITLTDINWEGCTAAMIRWLLTVENLNITGKIHMSASVTGQIPFTLKKALIERFGDIDDEDNDLYVEYNQLPLGSVTVTGDGYFDYEGEEKYYDLIPNVPSGNDIRSFEWSIVSGSSGIDPEDYLEISDQNGWFKCKQMGSESSKPTVTVQCVVTLTDGTTLSPATMDIRCYFRQAHIGDYVYHDGTWDDRLNVAKSVIGICFYCKQIYENGQPTGRYDRRMVALADGSSRQWGLYPNGASTGSNGFQSSGAGALTYDLNGVATAPFNVPNLDDITTTGASYTTVANMIDQNNPSQEYDDDDPQRYFKVYGDTTAIGRISLVQLSATIKNAVYGNDNMYSADSMVPQGLHDTAAIIAHRNNVLAGTTYDPDPETSGDETTYTAYAPNDTYPSNLAQKILDIRDFAEDTLGSSYPNIYSQYLYPAASEAFAYQPVISSNHVLADKFKSHHWYLPSIGEVARLCFLGRTCYSGASTYEAAAYNIFGDIYLNAVNAGLFTRQGSSLYWSSSEYSPYNAWLVNFGSGYIGSGYGKSSSYVVRPVAAF